jgi:hypothetical protein
MKLPLSSVFRGKERNQRERIRLSKDEEEELRGALAHSPENVALYPKVATRKPKGHSHKTPKELRHICRIRDKNFNAWPIMEYYLKDVFPGWSDYNAEHVGSLTLFTISTVLILGN